MTPAIAIEALRASDVEALCDLAREIWRAHYPAIIGEAQTEYMLARRYAPALVRAELERDEISWMLAREGDAMIAFASCVLEQPGELKLDKLYVHPSRQRSGLGALLLAHVCERARALGLDTVTLAVNKHNCSAIAAYRKYGFNIRAAVVKDIGGGFVMDDYVMARRLEE
jgi:ribosomal protein S18 acetylase RimI-like enzyme